MIKDERCLSDNAGHCWANRDEADSDYQFTER